jgi:hypothetical protein
MLLVCQGSSPPPSASLSVSPVTPSVSFYFLFFSLFSPLSQSHITTNQQSHIFSQSYIHNHISTLSYNNHKITRFTTHHDSQYKSDSQNHKNTNEIATTTQTSCSINKITNSPLLLLGARRRHSYNSTSTPGPRRPRPHTRGSPCPLVRRQGRATARSRRLPRHPGAVRVRAARCSSRCAGALRACAGSASRPPAVRQPCRVSLEEEEGKRLES